MYIEFCPLVLEYTHYISQRRQIPPRTSDYLGGGGGGKQYHTGGGSFYGDFERFFRKNRVKSYLQYFVENST